MDHNKLWEILKEMGIPDHLTCPLRNLYAGQDACNAGDLGSMPESGRSPGEGNGNLLQYSCLGNSMDRGTWWAAVHGVTKELDMT